MITSLRLENWRNFLKIDVQLRKRVFVVGPNASGKSNLRPSIPKILARLARKAGRQTLVSTHSADLLSDEGIDPGEVLVLTPSSEGTQVVVAESNEQIRDLLEGGMSIGEAVIPRTAPADSVQLALFGD